MECISLLGYAACAPDAEFRSQLAFPALDIVSDTIPAMLRRRSSRATQMAFTAATAACAQANRSPAALPAVFASVAGEICTTDQLCLELAKPDGVVSPSAFHNSVQNTAAGYWGIVQQCTQPASALAAGCDTFAMALLEAWCQLICRGGELLLVCYDENWPVYLAPGQGQPAFACALVLAAGKTADGMASIGRPGIGAQAFAPAWMAPASQMPILAAIPLLECLATANLTQVIALSPLSPGWEVEVEGLCAIHE